jgi:hypothetical protein
MLDFKKLDQRYMTDPVFNKLVNLTESLLKEYGFTPSEIREAQFYAQYRFEMANPQIYIRTAEEHERFLYAINRLKKDFLNNGPSKMPGVKDD